MASIHSAAQAGDIGRLTQLLSSGADVNATDDTGLTVLMIAAIDGHRDVVELLIDRGADVGATAGIRGTALMFAAGKGYRDVAELLIDRGAEVNATDDDGWTALMIAANKGHRDVVELLIDRGADVNATDDQGQTALMVAAMEVPTFGHVGGGADVYPYVDGLVDQRRRTRVPTHGFRPKDQRDVVELLEEAARRKVEEDATSSGRVFRDAAFAPEMMVIPAGEFLMGSPEDEEGRGEDEGPQHRVMIPAPFALGKYAVTFEEFDHFVRESGHDHKPEDANWGRGRQPVIFMSWNYAVAYCRWLSEETGHDYRLPTEAEWEYACRAGTTTPFHFGETSSTEQANYNGDFIYGNGREGVFRMKTMKVGRFPANAFGLHEMHGNVWEWCADCYENDAYEKYIDVYPDMVGDMKSWRGRVLRGGSWNDRPWNLRSASRDWDFSGNRDNNLGFRIARTVSR